ncbi:IclR family transcriptional regulator [Brachybacterium halotolerans subsp. kimchii]|uniref:IclR family transcriptional regulator n=1 Tax=Brachybacterium halotolerans TaxID=2795215 RepID=UPI001E45AC67|nr:IclR family transcriptional regulator [Brachybacterium halotolerans]UEJ81215.1 IclR family transcriptional regulator [Brachybacterium halotolerans subsp. kimchii]
MASRTPDQTSPKPPKAPAADATLRVLTYLSSRRAPVAAARVAQDLELPRSTTYDLLGTLVAHGYALHLPQERLYALGPAAYEVAVGYMRHAPLARVGRVVLERTVDAIGESGHLAVLHGRDVLYVVEDRAKGRGSLVTDQGVRLPAHLTATGRAMLAALPLVQLRSLFTSREDLVPRRPGVGPTTPAQLAAILEQVRRDGFAREDGEITPGYRSVAAPVLDHADWPIAAIGLTWQSNRLGEDKVAECTRAVQAAAEEVARAATGRRPREERAED